MYRDYSSVVEIAPPADGRGYRRSGDDVRRYGLGKSVWQYEAEPRSDFLS